MQTLVTFIEQQVEIQYCITRYAEISNAVDTVGGQTTSMSHLISAFWKCDNVMDNISSYFLNNSYDATVRRAFNVIYTVFLALTHNAPNMICYRLS
jgi:hypothetical protein